MYLGFTGCSKLLEENQPSHLPPLHCWPLCASHPPPPLTTGTHLFKKVFISYEGEAMKDETFRHSGCPEYDDDIYFYRSVTAC